MSAPVLSPALAAVVEGTLGKASNPQKEPRPVQPWVAMSASISRWEAVGGGWEAVGRRLGSQGALRYVM